MGNQTRKQGFTIIEAMVGLALLSITLLGVVAMMAYFGSHTSDRFLKNCLLDSAVNALDEYKSNALPVASSFTCRGMPGSVTLSTGTFPVTDTCSDVTATVSAGGKTLSLQTKVCNFR